MKKYDEYKDSGVAWLGEVPKHWEIRKIKTLSAVKRGASPRPIDDPKYFAEDGEFSWVRIADVSASDKYLTTTTQKLSKLGSSLSVKRFPGDIFISIAGTVGKPIISSIKCCIHDGFVYFPYLKNMNKEFLYYIFMSGQPYLGLGKMGTQLNLNTETIGNIDIPYPPITEQAAIATYLDTHCAKIDNLISIQQKRIALLQELKQSVITHAVTKGLNPNVEMKQSGVEWIGDVPKHWEVCKLKHYSHIVLGKMLMTSPPKDSEGLYTLEKYLKSKNVGWLQLFLDEDNIDEMWFNQYEKSIYKLQENDIVMNEGGDIGKVSCWRGVDFDCYIQNSINKITADYNRVNAGFLCYWLYNLSSLGYFWSIVSQISIAHLTKEKLSNSPVVLPPISEQVAIASYLDHKCATIDTSISNAQHQIDLLQEYKQSLITEVVTGKRKVTDN